MFTNIIITVLITRSVVGCASSRTQSTVDFPTGGDVNVLSDYKETEPEKILDFLHSHSNHVTDKLAIFR